MCYMPLTSYPGHNSMRNSRHKVQPRRTSYAEDCCIRALPALQVCDHIPPLQRAHLCRFRGSGSPKGLTSVFAHPSHGCITAQRDGKHAARRHCILI